MERPSQRVPFHIAAAARTKVPPAQRACQPPSKLPGSMCSSPSSCCNCSATHSFATVQHEAPDLQPPRLQARRSATSRPTAA